MKNNAVKTTINGIKFDSKSEGKYYSYLLEQQEQGMIEGFSLQPSFKLIPNFEYKGDKVLGMKYTADFLVTHTDGKQEVIEIKGYEDQMYLMRVKLFKYYYPDLHLTVISECPKKYGGGFVLLSDLKKLRTSEKRKKNAEKKDEQGATKQTKRRKS